MPNIFNWIDMVLWKQNELQELIHLKDLYDQELTEMKYNGSVILNNSEECLDYISFLEYTKCAVNELKIILSEKEKEKRKLQEEYSFSVTVLSALLKTVIKYSTFNKREFALLQELFNYYPTINFKEDRIPFFSNKCNSLVLNECLIDAPIDLIEFVKFYTNLTITRKDKNYSILDAYDLYNTKYPKLELV